MSKELSSLNARQRLYLEQFDTSTISKLNEEAKQRGELYVIVTDPKQVEGIQLGYVVKRALDLDKPRFIKKLMKKEYMPTPGSINTRASHESLWFPWAEGGDPTIPGTSIIGYSNDNQVAYAGGNRENIDHDFNYRGLSDPKEYYVKENGYGVNGAVTYDAKKMYEAVNDDASKTWVASQEYKVSWGRIFMLDFVSGHQCRGYVRNAAIEAYMQSGGKVYLIPNCY